MVNSYDTNNSGTRDEIISRIAGRLNRPFARKVAGDVAKLVNARLPKTGATFTVGFSETPLLPVEMSGETLAAGTGLTIYIQTVPIDGVRPARKLALADWEMIRKDTMYGISPNDPTAPYGRADKVQVLQLGHDIIANKLALSVRCAVQNRGPKSRLRFYFFNFSRRRWVPTGDPVEISPGVQQRLLVDVPEDAPARYVDFKNGMVRLKAELDMQEDPRNSRFDLSITNLDAEFNQ